MTSPSPRRGRRTASLATLAAIGAIAVSTGGTSAMFTDTGQVDSGDFIAGTFDLAAGIDSASLSFGQLVPGAQHDLAVTVSNSGTVDMHYSALGEFVAAGSGLNLGEALVLTVTDPAGTVVYAGTVGATAAQSVVVGDITAGQQDADRILLAGQQETLTFTVAYPWESDNTYQGASTALDVTFNAEQIRPGGAPAAGGNSGNGAGNGR